jgi:hypothetical protein
MVDSATREILHMFLVDFDATIINWKSLPNSGWDLQCGIEGACQPKRVVSALFSSASLLLSHYCRNFFHAGWVRERQLIGSDHAVGKTDKCPVLHSAFKFSCILQL